MVKLFFSYSHKDEALRNELEIHLSMLKRQGIIEAWHDRRIGAGSNLELEIKQEINSSDIILLLISPYFLASDYCYDIEMRRAMERHESGDAQVIPVILHPSDWHSAPFGKLMATPTDGKPVSKFANQHDAFLDITLSIKEAANKVAHISRGSEDINPANDDIEHTFEPITRSSNLRIKKEFTEEHKDTFLENTFEYIANFFEGSLDELSKRNLAVSSKFKRIDSNHFTAIIYRSGSAITQCKIWFGSGDIFSNSISYSSNIASSDNSFNDALSIDTDGYILFLKGMGMQFNRDKRDAQLSQQGAAEYFWEILINPLQ